MTIKESKWVILPSLALLIITAMHAPVFGGTTGKISGSVRGIETGEALPGANVVIVGTTLGAATDAAGDFFVINVPPGTYSVRVSMIGYAAETRTNVRVNVDRTTNVDFSLRTTVIPGEEVTAVAERPVIRPDLTASITEISGVDIELGPAENLQDQIRQQRGVLLGLSQLGRGGYRFSSVPSDELHLRGGRENETLFAIDGMTVNDPLWGGSDYIQNTSASSVAEMSTLAGTFNAEYGNAMSGVVNIVTREGTDTYQGHFSSYTDQLVAEWDQSTSQGEISLSGPVPLTGKKVTFFVNAQTRATDGYIYGYIYPNWVDSRGEEVDTSGIPHVGTPEEISMDKKELLNGLAKLTWRVSPKIKLSALAAYSDSKEAFYDHWMKYNPEGNPYHHSTELMLNLSLTHALSARTFYDLGVSHQQKTRFLGVYDSWDDYMVVIEDSDPTGNWSVAGEDWTWHHDDWETSGLRFALTSQVTKVHLLKTGVDYRMLTVHRDSRNPNEVGMFYINYDRQPTEVSAFLQDKMEFSRIGMILNAGVRFDMWDPDAPYWEDINRLADMETKQATPKSTVSPRFGVSYPISDVGAFHFAYGHFYQFPSYSLIYQGQRELTDEEDYYWDNPAYKRGELYYPMTEMYDFRLANGDMEPEKTVSYEAGVQTRLTEDVSIDITAFYREMSNLVGERFVAEAAAGAGLKYSDNYDYGNVKGVEIALNKRFSNYFSLRANYTFAKALITSSTPWAQIQVANPTYRTFTSNWDRPHTFSFDLLVGEPGNWTVGLYGNFQTGLPYSIRVEPNTERMPWLGNLDMRASKTFHFFGFEESVFLRVLNLLDHRNIYYVHESSGKSDLPLGIERNERNLNIYDDPSNYGPGRQVRLGLSVDF